MLKMGRWFIDIANPSEPSLKHIKNMRKRAKFLSNSFEKREQIKTKESEEKKKVHVCLCLFFMFDGIRFVG